MKLRSAFIASLKYNTLALIPTVAGLGIALAGLWFGAVAPLFDLIQSGAIQQLLQGQVPIPPGLNPLLSGGGLIAGYFVYRVGRTTLLFKVQGSALDTDTPSDPGGLGFGGDDESE